MGGLFGSRWIHRAAVALTLALGAPQPVTAQPSGEPARGGAPSSVRGRILEHETRAPLGSAMVVLVSRREGEGDPGFRISDEYGGFLFPRVAPGVYDLTVARMGYRNFLDTLVVAPDSDVRIVVELSPSPIELEAVVVTVPRSPSMAGFYERRRRGSGTFIDREEIEETNPLRVTDLLFMAPGVRFVHNRSGEREIRMRDDCRPTVWVNGTRVFDSAVGGIGLDQVIAPEDVEAMEVYRGAAAVPPQFAGTMYGPESCGAVVIWTRQRPPPVVEGKLWKRLLAAAGIVLGILLIR